MGAEMRFRIGELSRRSGVSPELLRAWERRYGLLRPTRSSGGLRLYAEADLERVRAMQEQLAAGLAAAEAAAVAAAAPSPAAAAPSDGASIRGELDRAILAFDEARAHAVVDRVVARFSLDAVLADVVLPYLHELGERWERGEVSVAQEHFASALLRGRLLGLGRGWGTGFGPLALLACAPGEQHDLGLIAFALALRARGWRIVYLGTDTPIASVADAARVSSPDRIVVGAVSPAAVASMREDLIALGHDWPLAVGGAAASALAGNGVVVLEGDPVEAAERLTRSVQDSAPPERQ